MQELVLKVVKVVLNCSDKIAVILYLLIKLVFVMIIVHVKYPTEACQPLAVNLFASKFATDIFVVMRNFNTESKIFHLLS